MAAWLVILVALTYAAILFAIAWGVDRRVTRDKGARGGVWMYGLSLGVYCTSWTLFGAVGTASTEGWTYLPIYLGPILAHLFLPRLLSRMIAVAKQENITSVADFLAARYGKSRSVAAFVTMGATIAVLPYLALQLKSVGLSYTALTGMTTGQDYGFFSTLSAHDVSALVTAILMAAFAILFGTRHADVTQQNRGLVTAVAFESVIKIIALLVIAIFAVDLLSTPSAAPPATPATSASITNPFLVAPEGGGFLLLTGVSLLAALCLPRQFHVGVVEARGAHWAKPGGQIFAVYLMLVAVCVIPITLAGLRFAVPGSPDLFVMTLPLSHHRPDLALLAFIGGVSASAGMIVVASIALSTMITNDLLGPLLMPRHAAAPNEQISGTLKAMRRLVVIGLLLAAFAIYRLLADRTGLADIGRIAFAATAQIGPLLLAGLYWRNAHRRGAVAGLSVGMVVWAYTLAMPMLLGAEAMARLPSWMIGEGSWLNPLGLLGGQWQDSYSHGVVWSLALNTATLVWLSRTSRHRQIDRTQSARFLFVRHDSELRQIEPLSALGLGNSELHFDFSASAAEPKQIKVPLAQHDERPVRATLGELVSLAGRFVGENEARIAFHKLRDIGEFKPLDLDAPADALSARLCERLLAGAIGAGSARMIVGNALSDAHFTLEDVAKLLDGANQQLQFSRELLQAALENMQQGVSVVDRRLRIVAWNTPYLRLFDYPAGLVRVGRPIADVIRFNADRGWCGAGDPNEHVRRRLAFLEAGEPHRFERRRPNGMVIRSHGQPIPGGGYVMSFTDITEEKLREEALTDEAARLEHRVRERTGQLEQANAALEAARANAEQANLGKTRFLAAASHDLLQPLNAARLFLSAAREDVSRQTAQANLQQDVRAAFASDTQGQMLVQVDRAIQSADQLIRTLLDISKLDNGGIKAEFSVVPLDPLFVELCEELRPQATLKGLKLRYTPTQLSVRTDRVLLRSVLQNYLSNAVRYTQRGGVLIGARTRQGLARIEVWDTGAGIADSDLDVIFEEFRRLKGAEAASDRGVGLGLAIVRRIAPLIEGQLAVRSRLDKGSVFSITQPLAASGRPIALKRRRSTSPAKGKVAGLRVLCLDDQPSARAGLSALLTRWGCVVRTAADIAEAQAALAEFGQTDVVIADFHLANGANGLDAIETLSQSGDFAALLLTADSSAATRDRASAAGIRVLNKPVDADALLAALVRAMQSIIEGVDR
jgi:Na+/proline symporter/signal transduction histidine kinase